MHCLLVVGGIRYHDMVYMLACVKSFYKTYVVLIQTVFVYCLSKAIVECDFPVLDMTGNV